MPANPPPRMRVHQIVAEDGTPDIVVSLPDIVRWLRHVQVHVYDGSVFLRERDTVNDLADIFSDHLNQINAATERGESIHNRTFSSAHRVSP